MADTPSPPPGWPFDQVPEDAEAPTPGPRYSFDGTEPPAQPVQPAPAQPAAPVPPQPAAPVPPQPAAPVSPAPIPPAPTPGGYQPPPPAPYQPPPPTPAGYAPPPPAPGQPIAPDRYFEPPPPGAMPPAPPGKKKRGVLFTVLGILGLLAVAIGGCSVWFYSTVTAPVDEANRFLAEIDRGDYQAASERMTCGLPVSANELNDLFQGQDIIYDLKSSNVTNSSAVVSGSLTLAQGSFPGTIEFRLQKINGDWNICSFGL